MPFISSVPGTYSAGARQLWAAFDELAAALRRVPVAQDAPGAGPGALSGIGAALRAVIRALKRCGLYSAVTDQTSWRFESEAEAVFAGHLLGWSFLDQELPLLLMVRRDGTLRGEGFGHWSGELADAVEGLRANLVGQMSPGRHPAPPPNGTEQGEGEKPKPADADANRPRRDPNKPSRDRQEDILAAIRAAKTPLTRPELIDELRLKTEGKLGANLAWMVTNRILINIPQRGYWPADTPEPE